MRNWLIAITLLLCLALVGSVACSPFGGTTPQASQQLVKVVQGDLTVKVSGSGKIDVSKEANLTFGVGGKVDQLFVEEGDYVTAGMVLAKLDTDVLELALTQAKVALTNQQVAVAQSQVGLRTAQHDLEQARDLYTWPDIEIAQANVDDAKAYIDYVSTNLEEAKTPEKQAMWEGALIYAQARLTAAEAKLDAMVKSYDTEEVAIKKMQVQAAEQSLGLSQQSLAAAQQSLDNAQKNLNEATLTASISGVVASVDIDEGDIIPSPGIAPKVVIHLVDLTTMELSVDVDEIDIPQVKLNQKVVVEVDALPGLNLEGKVISISLLPKEESGVVVYEVKIGFSVPEGSGLKVGMSATADIIIDERSNVLLVPDRAIKQDSQGNPVVEVMVGEQVQERPVVIGISDGIQTEIVSGLKEGEVVVIEKPA